MSTPVITPPPEQIDSAAFIQKRNEGEAAKLTGKEAPAPKVEEPAKVEEKKTEEPKQDEQPRLPRSVRREINRLREEAAEARGRLAVYQELGIKPGDTAKAAPATSDDPEPQATDFESEGAYQRALGRWDARQEAKKLIGSKDQEVKATHEAEQFSAHVQAMTAKMIEDSKKIPDYDKVAKESAEDPDAIKPDWAKHENLLGMIAESDVRAYVLFYLAKHQDEFQALLDLTASLPKQLRYFARLEERAEKLYTPQQNSEAAQASDKSKDESKDRTHPAEAQAGRNTAERDALKPRPSTEVAARGGSAPPDEPIAGTAAWMAKRNQATGGR